MQWFWGENVFHRLAYSIMKQPVLFAFIFERTHCCTNNKNLTRYYLIAIRHVCWIVSPFRKLAEITIKRLSHIHSWFLSSWNRALDTSFAEWGRKERMVSDAQQRLCHLRRLNNIHLTGTTDHQPYLFKDSSQSPVLHLSLKEFSLFVRKELHSSPKIDDGKIIVGLNLMLHTFKKSVPASGNKCRQDFQWQMIEVNQKNFRIIASSIHYAW